ncbi:MAG: sulfatase [Pirellulaceae bacterium]|jgi:arylsulfatase A-like enzyme|nr:sulfatase [Pirellulaceae bacterium]MDP6553612.1 sulfatase [Pirellulaceae bacterium]
MWSTVQAADAASKRSHVLFIAIDDLNDWIGCLGGHPDCRTPNIDRLAGRSVLFTRAYCAAPACNPSRAALLTGIRPSTSGVYLNSHPWRPALPKAVTLPQHFSAHGYRSIGGGKIFHGRYPDDASWQFYFKKAGDPVPPNRPLNGIANTAHFDWGPLNVADRTMDDHRVVDWAIGALGRKPSQPTFIACGIFRPHLPWYVPQKYFDQFPLEEITLPQFREDDLKDVPAAGIRMAKPTGDHRKVIESDNWRRAVQGYLASIAFADAQVGRLLAALDNGPMSDNTIVVLWGDHGWHLGEKSHWRKFALWDEAARVPLMISASGVSKPSVCDRTVSLMDLYPTLADLCDLPIGDHLEGRSLRVLLRNPQADWDRPVLTTHGRNNHSVRSERWRYIRYANGSEELYDHANDPQEWTNLATREDLGKVRSELAKWLPQVNVPNADSAVSRSKKRVSKQTSR